MLPWPCALSHNCWAVVPYLKSYPMHLSCPLLWQAPFSAGSGPALLAFSGLSPLPLCPVFSTSPLFCSGCKMFTSLPFHPKQANKPSLIPHSSPPPRPPEYLSSFSSSPVPLGRVIYPQHLPPHFPLYLAFVLTSHNAAVFPKTTDDFLVHKLVAYISFLIFLDFETVCYRPSPLVQCSLCGFCDTSPGVSFLPLATASPSLYISFL